MTTEPPTTPKRRRPFRFSLRALLVAHLQGLTQLQVLSLDGARVTDAGIAELHKALPNCKIVR